MNAVPLTLPPPLVGTFEHLIDGKGRLVLPSKFRHHFGESLYVSPGSNYLALYTAEVFAEMLHRMTERAREGEMTPMAWRALAAQSEEVRTDAQGRILIPLHLREMAGLSSSVAVTGAVNRVEIWDLERWVAQKSAMDAALRDELSGPVGI